MTGADYAAHAYSVLQSTNDVIYDAMRAQGLVAQIGADTANLQSLMSASQSAQGALAAAQAGNQIAVLNTQQMMRLQQIMAASNQAQTAYYAEISNGKQWPSLRPISGIRSRRKPSKVKAPASFTRGGISNV
jgi:P-type conjugative transfer protein TrbJ